MTCYAHVVSADQTVNFTAQIAPILAQHCVRCHSPAVQRGDLSLTTPSALFQSGHVVAGDPDGSHLLEVITSQDNQRPAMPKEGAALSSNDVTLIRKWIQQGAKWPKGVIVQEKSKADPSWWSYQPLLEISQPPQSIDDFIRARLAQQNLQPSPRADRRTLIRRLYFDLHGLPPTPEAVQAFLQDDSPQAYEALVDRLLESEHYGERFARHWLDLAHYADTHGFERDKRRENAWRYRDYVIQAFNDDKPYDRFLQEQIAGDVLWPEDMQAVIATGFLAAGPWDFVGQVETRSPILRRSARSLDLDDMATQVMTATMAVTVNCARCHDHKLDPISQREYYQLRSVFAGARREDRVVSDTALKHYEKRKQRLLAKRNEIDFEIGRLTGQGLDLADIVGGGNGLGTGTYRNALDPRNAKVQTRDFGKLGNVRTNTFSPCTFDFVDGVFIPNGDSGKAQIPVTSTGITATGLPTTSGDAWDMIRNGPVASQHSPELDGINFTQDGHSLLGLHANAGITFDITALRKQLAQATPAKGNSATPTVLRFTAQLGYFGAVGNYFADAWVLLDGQKVAEFRQLRRADGLQSIDIEISPKTRFLTLLATDGGNGYSMDQIGFGDPQIQLAAPPSITDENRKRLTELRERRTQTAASIQQLGPPPRFYGIVSEQQVPEIKVLVRGDPETASGEPLEPAALSTLAMLNPKLGSHATSEGERRAALAHWITHPDNPLVRRVIVNRLWQWHFGDGIVDTPSDFGFGGGRPSHPELLDWLAQELVRNQWSLKAMHRLIVTSQTYQQASYAPTTTADQADLAKRPVAGDKDRAQAAKIDSENQLFWRQNPRRIEAEAIRDTVLSISGKLNLQRGGPGFEDFIYQDAYAPIYTYVTADKPELWRRSIYRYVVRTTPNRFLSTLDCPDPANFTPKRLTTTTPLQSLALYNNDFMLRQARYFAQRVTKETGPNENKQVTRAFALAFGRGPTPTESQIAVKLVKERGLLTFCRALLNTNELIYVD